MKTVAIVGSHPLTRDAAPWNDLSKDLWVFNAGAIFDWCKRATAVFEIHPAGEYTNPMSDRSEYWNEFLQKQTVADVWMQEVDPRVPKSRKYPLDEITKKYLHNFKRGLDINRYFTSSPCYSIALAILQGYQRIELYGIEMETNSEYIYQRDGVGLWIGIALGCGVQVVIPEHTSMFSAPLYGYDDDHTKLTREDMEDNAMAVERALADVVKRLEEKKAKLDYVITTIETMKQEGKPQEEIAKLGNDYGRLTGEYEQALADYADLNGQLKVFRFLLAKLDKMAIANGQAAEVTALRSAKIRSFGAAA